MKRWHLLIGSILLIVLACVFLLRGQAAQTAVDPVKSQRTITVIGSATVTGKPDSARVYIGVVTNGKTVADAREANGKAVAKVQDAIMALKITDLKTRTLQTRVGILYDKGDRSHLVGYEVSQSFTVLVKESDIDKLGAAAGRILDASLQNGANSEGDIEFFTEDDTELRRQARSKAVEDAL